MYQPDVTPKVAMLASPLTSHSRQSHICSDRNRVYRFVTKRCRRLPSPSHAHDLSSSYCPDPGTFPSLVRTCCQAARSPRRESKDFDVIDSTKNIYIAFWTNKKYATGMCSRGRLCRIRARKIDKTKAKMGRGDYILASGRRRFPI